MGGRDHSFELNRTVTLAMDVAHVDVTNMGMFLKGAVIADNGGIGIRKTFTVKRGLRYCVGDVKITNLVLQNLEGTVTYQVDLNYDPDLEVGSFLIQENQVNAASTIVDGGKVVAIYDCPGKNIVVPFTKQAEEYALRFEGMNTAEGDLPVILECFRVSQGVVYSLAQISSSAEPVAVTGALLKQEFMPEGEQYFREIMV